jgi:rhodanese-related sulfurtransferase
VATISTDQAEELLEEGVRFVDVRTVEEFQDGHVPGAINVPISVSGPGGMQPNSDFIAVMEACFNKDEQIIVSCKAGGRSARAAQELLAAGFSDVLDMTAGFDGKKTAFGEVIPGWSAEGREVEMEADASQTYEFLKKEAGL